MTNNYFHIAEIDSTTRGPLYTLSCLLVVILKSTNDQGDFKLELYIQCNIVNHPQALFWRHYLKSSYLRDLGISDSQMVREILYLNSEQVSFREISHKTLPLYFIEAFIHHNIGPLLEGL